MKNIRPLYDRILVERVAENNTTAGGIVIPPSAQEKAQTGKVVAVGQGRVLDNGTVQPLQVKVGDTVFFAKFAGTELDDDRVIIREDEIFGIVE